MGSLVGSTIGAAGSYFAGKEMADATQEAAKIAAEASKYGVDVQNAMFNKQIELQRPWQETGMRALQEAERVKGFMPAAFTGKVDLASDPGYAFRLSEGLKALNRSAAARGGMISGGALKAAERYGQDYASQEYNNAYNRALTEYNAAVNRENTGYNRLASLAGVGQTAVNALSNAAGTTGANVASTAMTGGSNAANAALAGGQAIGSMYKGIGANLGYGIGKTDWSDIFSNKSSGGIPDDWML